jgi:hypothetical protein
MGSIKRQDRPRRHATADEGSRDRRGGVRLFRCRRVLVRSDTTSDDTISSDSPLSTAGLERSAGSPISSANSRIKASVVPSAHFRRGHVAVRP